jgi:hypothetical protein
MKASDHSCVPLCADCHRLAQWAYHRVGKRAFEQRQGLSFLNIAANLNQEWSRREPHVADGQKRHDGG